MFGHRNCVKLLLEAMPLQQVQAEDICRITQLHFDAFTDPFHYEPYHEVLYPGGNTPKARCAAAERDLRNFRESPGSWLKVVDDESGEIVSAAVWSLSSETSVETDAALEADWCSDEDQRAFSTHVIRTVYRRRREHVGGTPYISLELLMTDPKHQGRGAGQMIVQRITELADERDWQAVLESTKWARPLYEKHGFEVVERAYVEVPEKWL